MPASQPEQLPAGTKEWLISRERTHLSTNGLHGWNGVKNPIIMIERIIKSCTILKMVVKDRESRSDNGRSRHMAKREKCLPSRAKWSGTDFQNLGKSTSQG